MTVNFVKGDGSSTESVNVTADWGALKDDATANDGFDANGDAVKSVTLSGGGLRAAVSLNAEVASIAVKFRNAAKAVQWTIDAVDNEFTRTLSFAVYVKDGKYGVALSEAQPTGVTSFETVLAYVTVATAEDAPLDGYDADKLIVLSSRETFSSSALVKIVISDYEMTIAGSMSVSVVERTPVEVTYTLDGEAHSLLHTQGNSKIMSDIVFITNPFLFNSDRNGSAYSLAKTVSVEFESGEVKSMPVYWYVYDERTGWEDVPAAFNARIGALIRVYGVLGETKDGSALTGAPVNMQVSDEKGGKHYAYSALIRLPSVALKLADLDFGGKEFKFYPYPNPDKPEQDAFNITNYPEFVTLKGYRGADGSEFKLPARWDLSALTYTYRGGVGYVTVTVGNEVGNYQTLSVPVNIVEQTFIAPIYGTVDSGFEKAIGGKDGGVNQYFVLYNPELHKDRTVFIRLSVDLNDGSQVSVWTEAASKQISDPELTDKLYVRSTLYGFNPFLSYGTDSYPSEAFVIFFNGTEYVKSESPMKLTWNLSAVAPDYAGGDFKASVTVGGEYYVGSFVNGVKVNGTSVSAQSYIQNVTYYDRTVVQISTNSLETTTYDAYQELVGKANGGDSGAKTAIENLIETAYGRDRQTASITNDGFSVNDTAEDGEVKWINPYRLSGTNLYLNDSVGSSKVSALVPNGEGGYEPIEYSVGSNRYNLLWNMSSYRPLYTGSDAVVTAMLSTARGGTQEITFHLPVMEMRVTNVEIPLPMGTGDTQFVWSSAVDVGNSRVKSAWTINPYADYDMFTVPNVGYQLTFVRYLRNEHKDTDFKVVLPYSVITLPASYSINKAGVYSAQIKLGMQETLLMDVTVLRTKIMTTKSDLANILQTAVSGMSPVAEREIGENLITFRHLPASVIGNVKTFLPGGEDKLYTGGYNKVDNITYNGKNATALITAENVNVSGTRDLSLPLVWFGDVQYYLAEYSQSNSKTNGVREFFPISKLKKAFVPSAKSVVRNSSDVNSVQVTFEITLPANKAFGYDLEAFVSTLSGDWTGGYLKNAYMEDDFGNTIYVNAEGHREPVALGEVNIYSHDVYEYCDTNGTFTTLPGDYNNIKVLDDSGVPWHTLVNTVEPGLK
jgi:hypothetical protein